MRTTWPVFTKLTFEWNAVIALPALLIATVVAAIVMPRQADAIISLVELLAPICAVIAFAHLLAIDSEERVLELRYSYPPERWRLVVERALPAFAVMVATIGAAALIVSTFVPGFGPCRVLAIALPPVAALLGLTGLVAVLTGSRLLAALPAIFWWMISCFTFPPGRSGPAGAVQGPFHLDQFSRTLAHTSLLVNRLALVGWGLLALVVAALILERRAG